MNSLADDKSQLLKEFMTGMNMIHRCIMHSSREAFPDKKATVLQVEAMQYIHEHNDCNVSELGTYLHMSSSAITQLVRRLIRLELVTQCDDTQDRRLSHLRMTILGEKERIHLQERLKKSLEIFLNYISLTDLKDLVRINRNILNQMKEKHIA